MTGGNKRRRVDAGSGSGTISSSDAQRPSMRRLNELIAEAVKYAKTVEPGRGDGPLIKKAKTLTNSLLKAIPVDSTGIQYEEKTASLKKELNALNKHCNNSANWRQYEWQAEMISTLSGHINDWLAHIWLCMQEEDIVDMKIVEKAMLFCTETTKKLMNCHTQADHEECTNYLTTVVDASGSKVYEEEHASMKHYVAWMWRELLVTSTSRNLPMDSILENAKRFKLVGKILELMRKPNVDEGKKENADGYGFWDGHWSDAMKAAAVQVRTALKAFPADERRKIMSTANNERFSASSTLVSSSHDDEDKPTLSRVRELLLDAIAVANAIDLDTLGFKDTPSVNEVHALTHSLLQILPCDAFKVTKYEEHKASFDKELNELYEFCFENRYSKGGWIDESDKINDLLSKITEWFGQLWLLMQVEYIDMKAIEKALVFGSDTVETIKRCDMQVEFEDMDHAVRILDAEGETVYTQEYGSINLTLAWMWRELLVLSATRNLPTHSILNNIGCFDLLKEVFKIMPQKYEEEEENEDEDEEWEREEEGFWHGHWSDAMKAAALNIRAGLTREKP